MLGEGNNNRQNHAHCIDTCVLMATRWGYLLPQKNWRTHSILYLDCPWQNPPSKPCMIHKFPQVFREMRKIQDFLPRKFPLNATVSELTFFLKKTAVFLWKTGGFVFFETMASLKFFIKLHKISDYTKLCKIPFKERLRFASQHFEMDVSKCSLERSRALCRLSHIVHQGGSGRTNPPPKWTAFEASHLTMKNEVGWHIFAWWWPLGPYFLREKMICTCIWDRIEKNIILFVVVLKPRSHKNIFYMDKKNPRKIYSFLITEPRKEKKRSFSCKKKPQMWEEKMGV